MRRLHERVRTQENTQMNKAQFAGAMDVQKLPKAQALHFFGLKKVGCGKSTTSS